METRLEHHENETKVWWWLPVGATMLAAVSSSTGPRWLLEVSLILALAGRIAFWRSRKRGVAENRERLEP